MKKILLVMLLATSIILSGCTIGGTHQEAEDLGLNSVQSDSELKSLLKKTSDSLSNGWFSFNRGGIMTDDMEGNPSAEADSQYTSSSTYKSDDYTTTNVQVEGVDEGDIMKTDGRRIYSISWDRLQVIELRGEGQMEIVLSEEIQSVREDGYESYTYYSELYVTDKYLIVIGQKYEYYITLIPETTDPTGEADDPDKGDITTDYYYSRYMYTYTSMSVIDVYDIETLIKTDTYEVSGYLLGSRLIGNNLYLISNHYAYNYYLDDEDYDPRPWSLHDGEATFFDYADIKYLPEMMYQSFTVITTAYLEDTITYDNDVFLGSQSWGQIYVSENAIYLATTYYEQNLLGIYEEKGKLISYQFDTVNGDVFYGGMGIYSGYVINQFAMDEYNGYLRVATTEGWGETVANRLFVFERKLVDGVYELQIVGSIEEGLGKPGERIQSVRFNGDSATVVTFLRTDPLYTLDLSDPANPIIAGELQVTGFSVYQHLWTDNLIIGIGFEATEQGITTGMKLSLYDVTDKAHPVEVGTPLVLSNNETSWSYSEALWNHKAILIDKDRGFMGFSLWRSNWTNGYYSSMNDYIIFDVDETREQPIQVRYTINHLQYCTQNPDLYAYYWYYDFTIQRAFRVDDYLYVISGEVATSHYLLGDMSVVDDVIFQRAIADPGIVVEPTTEPAD